MRKPKKRILMTYRKQLRMSQAELARRIGVTPQSVSLWEIGEVNPTYDNVFKMSQVFDVATEKLYQELLDEDTTFSKVEATRVLIPVYKCDDKGFISIKRDHICGNAYINYGSTDTMIAIVVNDNKMDLSFLPNGSRAIIRKQGVVSNGTITALTVNDVFKIGLFYFENSSVTLKFKSSKKTPDETYDLNKTTVQIIGQVVGFQGEF